MYFGISGKAKSSIIWLVVSVYLWFITLLWLAPISSRDGSSYLRFKILFSSDDTIIECISFFITSIPLSTESVSLGRSAIYSPN
jgi:hypothetical protein